MLTQRGFTIVDKARLQRAFSPIVSTSKEKLAEETHRHRALISQRYGEEAQKAFDETESLDAPVVLESYYAQQAADLAAGLADARRRAEAAAARGKLGEKERQELERLRADEKLRQQKKRSKARAAASKKAKKRGKRG